MTIARKQLIDLSHTPYYHCINRCVRRAWLCGDDPLTGKNYDGRKQSIVNRMKFLTTVFGIELCAYVVMSNHYHVVLHVNAELIDNLTEKEVAKRWVQVYKNAIGIRYIEGAKLDIKEQEAMNTYLPIWRERLKDISWYMRALNEGIARKANKEDDCKGHFWEGRFKSQALTDEAALLACMAYVDLNPIRAKIAKTPEDSNHTSIQEHIIAHQQQNNIKLSKKLKNVLKDNPQNIDNSPKYLKTFSQQNVKNDQALPIERESYLELVDYTGKAIRSGKRGAIPENLKPILIRLSINPAHWVSTVSTYKQAFGKVVGSIAKLDDWRNTQNQKDETNTKWLKGNKAARDLYA
ncbi:MAG: transposase [Kangiella sp.]|nr:MAG: transposase [Kangiella sp.]